MFFGEEKQTQPPRLADDVKSPINKGVADYVVAEDLTERGLEQGHLIDDLQSVSRAGVAALLAGYDQVWHW